MAYTHELEQNLFAATDGESAIMLVTALEERATTDATAWRALGRYMLEGSIPHVREFAAALLASVDGPRGKEEAQLFARGLQEKNGVGYWSALGLVTASGREAYPVLVRIAQDENRPLDQRAHAIQCLAIHAGQDFHRGLPEDPGLWRPEDLRMSELVGWEVAGFPTGGRQAVSDRDPAFDQPQTELEFVVVKLDQRVSRSRARPPSPGKSSSLFVPASPSDLAAIESRWPLPAVYREFLSRFSPSDFEIGGVRIFGASELMEAQNGYGWNPLHQQPNPEWPASCLVVGSWNADPFVLRLDGPPHAPVSIAEHGEGEWIFLGVAPSFVSWLEQLAR